MPHVAELTYAEAKKSLADLGIEGYEVVADGPGDEAQDDWVVKEQYPTVDFMVNHPERVELTVVDPDETPEQKAERVTAAKAAAEKKAADEKKAKAEAEAKKKAEAAAKKKAEEEAKKKAEAKLKPRVYEGFGDDIVKIKKFDAEAGQVATFEHSGGSNFAVKTLDDNMESSDLLVNEIGYYKGTVYFDEGWRSSGTTRLEITADGPWKVTLTHPDKVKKNDGKKTISGTGDTVFRYTGEGGAAKITHNGSSNFAVLQDGTGGDLLINEIGVYEGTVRFPGGSLYEIKADGAWTIDVE